MPPVFHAPIPSLHVRADETAPAPASTTGSSTGRGGGSGGLMTAPLAGIIAGIVIISIILVVLIYYYCKRRQARPVPDFLEVKVSISAHSGGANTPAPLRTDFPRWGQNGKKDDVETGSGSGSGGAVRNSTNIKLKTGNTNGRLSLQSLAESTNSSDSADNNENTTDEKTTTTANSTTPRVAAKPPRLSLRLPPRISLVPSFFRGMMTPSTARSARSSMASSSARTPSTARSSRFVFGFSSGGSENGDGSVPPMPALPPSVHLRDSRLSLLSSSSKGSASGSKKGGRKHFLLGKGSVLGSGAPSDVSSGPDSDRQHSEDGRSLLSDDAVADNFLQVHPMNRARSMKSRLAVVNP